MESRKLRILNMCGASIPPNINSSSISANTSQLHDFKSSHKIHESGKSRLDDVHKPVENNKVQESAVIVNESTTNESDNQYFHHTNSQSSCDNTGNQNTSSKPNLNVAMVEDNNYISPDNNVLIIDCYNDTELLNICSDATGNRPTSNITNNNNLNNPSLNHSHSDINELSLSDSCCNNNVVNEDDNFMPKVINSSISSNGSLLNLAGLTAVDIESNDADIELYVPVSSYEQPTRRNYLVNEESTTSRPTDNVTNIPNVVGLPLIEESLSNFDEIINVSEQHTDENLIIEGYIPSNVGYTNNVIYLSSLPIVDTGKSVDNVQVDVDNVEVIINRPIEVQNISLSNLEVMPDLYKDCNHEDSLTTLEKDHKSSKPKGLIAIQDSFDGVEVLETSIEDGNNTVTNAIDIGESGLSKLKTIKLNKRKVKKKQVNSRLDYKKMHPNPCLGKKCKNDCLDFSEEERLLLFHEFNKCQLYEERKNWLLNCMFEIPVKRKRTKSVESRRKNTVEYKVVVNGVRKQVCQQFLIKTLDISQMTLRHTLQNASDTHLAKPDMRGKSTPKSKSSENQISFLKKFIENIPVVPSHYCRKKIRSYIYLQKLGI